MEIFSNDEFSITYTRKYNLFNLNDLREVHDLIYRWFPITHFDLKILLESIKTTEYGKKVTLSQKDGAKIQIIQSKNFCLIDYTIGKFNNTMNLTSKTLFDILFRVEEIYRKIDYAVKNNCW